MIEKSKEPFCNIEFKIYDALAFPIALRLNTSSEDFRYYLKHVSLHTDSKLLKGKMCQQFCEKKMSKTLAKNAKISYDRIKCFIIYIDSAFISKLTKKRGKKWRLKKTKRHS